MNFNIINRISHDTSDVGIKCNIKTIVITLLLPIPFAYGCLRWTARTSLRVTSTLLKHVVIIPLSTVLPEFCRMDDLQKMMPVIGFIETFEGIAKATACGLFIILSIPLIMLNPDATLWLCEKIGHMTTLSSEKSDTNSNRTKAPEDLFTGLTTDKKIIRLQEAIERGNEAIFNAYMKLQIQHESNETSFLLDEAKKISNTVFLSIFSYIMEINDPVQVNFFSVFRFQLEDGIHLDNGKASKRFIKSFAAGKVKNEFEGNFPLYLDQKFSVTPINEIRLTPLEFSFLTIDLLNTKNILNHKNLWQGLFEAIDVFVESKHKTLFEKLHDDLFEKIIDADKKTLEANTYHLRYKCCGTTYVNFLPPIKEGARNWHKFLIELTDEMLQNKVARKQILNCKANCKRLLILSRITQDPEFMIKIDILLKAIKGGDSRSIYPGILAECKETLPKLFESKIQIPFDKALATGLENLHFNFNWSP